MKNCCRFLAMQFFFVEYGKELKAEYLWDRGLRISFEQRLNNGKADDERL